MSEHAIILAGGRGSRLAPYTYILPKPLMPLGHTPIMEVIIRQLRAANVRHIHVAVGYLAEIIESYFGDGSKLGVNIYYYRESKPLGTAAPVRFVTENWASDAPIPDRFIVMNGDLLMDIDFAQFLDAHEPGSLSILLAEKTIKIDLGVLKLNAEQEISDYIEKPTYNFHVSTGVYVFSKSLVAHIPEQQRFDLPDLVKLLLPTSTKIRSVPLSQIGSLWLDLGRIQDYQEGQELFEADPGRFCDLEDP